MASIDRRNLILTHLFTVLQRVQGPNTYWHNRDGIPQELLPGLVLLDGDEDADRAAESKGRPGSTPNLVTIKPEIYLTLPDRKPLNENVSEDLNLMRKSVLKLVLTDARLEELVGSNGTIYYLGCMTDLARGRRMGGEMGILLDITYILRPSEL